MTHKGSGVRPTHKSTCDITNQMVSIMKNMDLFPKTEDEVKLKEDQLAEWFRLKEERDAKDNG